MAVMIGIDPHKGSHTAVAVGSAEEPLGTLRVWAGPDQASKLVAWAAAADRERALNLLPYDANQARWRYCTYLVATPGTAAGRGTP
jgi:hypothetical protein